MKLLNVVAITVLLAGCGDGQKTISGQDVMTQLQQTGVAINDVTTADPAEKSPVPNSYKEWLSFSIPQVAPSGGQVFICERKEYCDAIYAYFDGYRGLVGPYLYLPL